MRLLDTGFAGDVSGVLRVGLGGGLGGGVSGGGGGIGDSDGAEKRSRYGVNYRHDARKDHGLENIKTSRNIDVDDDDDEDGNEDEYEYDDDEAEAEAEAEVEELASEPTRTGKEMLYFIGASGDVSIL